MNTFLLIEQSYIDDTTKQFMLRHFGIKYNLKYFTSTPKSHIVGNVGLLSSTFSENDFQQYLVEIVNDIQKYAPFIKFLGCYYKNYWISPGNLEAAKNLDLSKSVKIKLALNHQQGIFRIDQALNHHALEIIILLNSKFKN